VATRFGLIETIWGRDLIGVVSTQMIGAAILATSESLSAIGRTVTLILPRNQRCVWSCGPDSARPTTIRATEPPQHFQRSAPASLAERRESHPTPTMLPHAPWIPQRSLPYYRLSSQLTRRISCHALHLRAEPEAPSGFRLRVCNPSIAMSSD